MSTGIVSARRIPVGQRMTLCTALIALGFDVRMWSKQRYIRPVLAQRTHRTMVDRVDLLVDGGTAYLYETAKARYRDLVKVTHPDVGGTHEQMSALNRAMDFIERRYKGA